MIRVFIIGILLLGNVFWGTANAGPRETLKGDLPRAAVKSDYVPEQLIVVFVEGTSEERINKINNTLNVKVLDENFGFIYLVEVPPGKTREELQKEFKSFKEEVKSVNRNLGLKPQ